MLTEGMQQNLSVLGQSKALMALFTGHHQLNYMNRILTLPGKIPTVKMGATHFEKK